MQREKTIAIGVAAGVAVIDGLLFALTRKPQPRTHLGDFEPVQMHQPGTPEYDRIRRGLPPKPARRRRTRRTGVSDPVVHARAQKLLEALAETFDVPAPDVTFGLTSHHAKYHRAQDGSRIDIRLAEGRPWSEALEYSILHEFAHHVNRTRNGRTAKSRGPEFQQALCDVLRQYGKAFTGPVSEYKTVKACVLRSPAAPLVREGYAKPRYAEDARREALVHALAELYKRTKGGLTLPRDENRPLPERLPDFRKRKVPRIAKLRRFQEWEHGKTKRYPNWTLGYFLERKRQKDPLTRKWMSWYNFVLPDGTIYPVRKTQIIGEAR